MIRLPGHVGICGPSECGKSNVGKLIAGAAYNSKIPVLVLDPNLSRQWPCDWITSDPEKFLRKAKTSEGCLLILDDVGDIVEDVGIAFQKKMKWLVRLSRHQGHKTLLLMHQSTDVLPSFRINIKTLFLFNTLDESAADWSRAFADKSLLHAPALPPYHFIMKERGLPARFMKPLPNVSKK